MLGFSRQSKYAVITTGSPMVLHCNPSVILMSKVMGFPAGKTNTLLVSSCPFKRTLTLVLNLVNTGGGGGVHAAEMSGYAEAASTVAGPAGNRLVAKMINKARNQVCQGLREECPMNPPIYTTYRHSIPKPKFSFSSIMNVQTASSSKASCRKRRYFLLLEEIISSNCVRVNNIIGLFEIWKRFN